MSMLEEFRDQINAIDSPEERTELLLQLARAFRSNRQLSQAAECYEEAAKLADTPRRQMSCRYEYAELLMATAKYKEALPVLIELADASQRNENHLRYEQLLNYIGVCYKESGDYDNALDYYNRANEIFARNNDLEGMTGTIINIANIYKTFGRLEPALERYEEVLKLIGDKPGFESHLALIHSAKGSIYRKQGEFQTAQRNYEQSLAIKQKLQDHYGVCHNLNSLALLYKDQGMFDRALTAYKQCLELEREMEFDSLIAITLSNIGQAYIKLEKYGMAEDYLREGLAKAKQIEAQSTIMQNYLLHAQLYAARRDTEKTFEYFMRYDELKSRLLNEKALKRMHELENKLDIERERHEAEIYRLRSEELETNNTALKEANQRLQQAQEEIRALERRNSVYAMAVTANHEMNQPLMIIQGNLDMLELEVDLSVGNAKRHLDRIRESIERLNAILAQFRQFEEVRVGEYSADTPMVFFEDSPEE